MATYNFDSSPGRDRFIRLTRLLIAGGTPILREVLRSYHNPSTLAACVALVGKKLVLTKPQKQLLSLDGPPGSLPNFDKFDICLIFKLLRNCCGLTKPGTKWNKLPEESDESLEADIVRIDFYRNDIYGHTLEGMAICTQEDFDKYWAIISDALCRMAAILTGSDRTLKIQIQELRHSRLTDDDLSTVQEFLQNIEAKEDQIIKGIEGIQDTMINAALQRMKISDDKTHTAVAASPLVQYNFIYNQFGPDFKSESAQGPQQPCLLQGIRRQVSEGMITPSIPPRPFMKSYSLPSNVHQERRFSHEEFRNPVDKFQLQNPSVDEYQRVSSPSVQQSPNKTAVFGSQLYAGQEYSPNPLANEAARTWTTPSAQGFSRESYQTSGRDREAALVNMSFSNEPNEWLSQRQQQDQEPLLRIEISVRAAGSLDFHLGNLIKSGTDISQFTSYLGKKQLIIKKIDGNPNGDCCFIEVSPRDLQSLEELWHDCIVKDLREFVKEIVLPEDFRGEVDVNIDGEEYKRCCESLRPREFKDSGRHSQSLSQVGMAACDASIPSKTVRRSQSVMDVPATLNIALQELLQLICSYGGRMDWQKAQKLLYIDLTKPEFTQYMSRYLEILPNNAVQVKLKFCPKMRKDSTCDNTNCPDLHLCFYHFLTDDCQYTTNCKNSHNISDDHTNNMFRMANLSFLNVEQRKQLVRNVAYVAPEICIYYNKRSSVCTKGSNCPYLHVCKDWVVGRCGEGSRCQRAHTFSNPHEKDILKKKNLDRKTEKEIIHRLKEHYS
ncbi:uncharacterized protein LOC116291313 [Actinia tenebrosa]|uniref:Uncharacterized protein LOC116291313 n=1 Tax=Actinia tenebrosa TaxID=6105 RepID=A0A6P8HD58_ACTTE|nr:uncharacterized protein LOC116291313 [Actinia tenebrosa]